MWYIHVMEYYSDIKMSEVLIYATAWMKLRNCFLGEKKQIHTCIWNLIYGTNEYFHRKETHGLGEQTHGCRGGEGGRGMDWKFGVRLCKLLHLEWVSNEVQLDSTGNHI